MSRLRAATLASAALTLATFTACVNGTGPDTERVRVTLQQAAVLPSQGVAALVTAGGQSLPIVRDDVTTLTASLTGIEFLPADNGDGSGEEGGWIALAVDPPVAIDLTSLPTEAEAPLVIAAGDLAIGDYRNVRLFVSEPTIVFARDINLGAAFTFVAGQSYVVTIPSGEQTGIKTDTDFSVAENAGVIEVHLLFDPTATFQNVAGTGTGNVILAPVIREMN